MTIEIDLYILILSILLVILFIVVAYILGDNKNTIDYIKVMSFDKLEEENKELKEALRLNKKYKR